MGRLVTPGDRLAWVAAGVLLVLALRVPSAQGERVRRPAGAGHPAVTFQTADNCMACHNGIATPEGEDVSLGVAWRASMMANSARDPYWQASVRREAIDHPLAREAIEDECATCHMPMARALARAAGRPGEVFGLLPPLKGDSEQHRLAADGVSCTLCHQIGSDRLGTRESFVGGFVIAPPQQDGGRMFGPFDVERGRTSLMKSATGTQPAEAGHVGQSELCATCHTLYTEARGAKGEVLGTLPEQVPYLEWRHSAYEAEQSCQSCHMPRASQTPIASVLGEPREHLGRHTFLGGNFFMLRLLNRHRHELGVTAPTQELDAAAHATVRQLQTATATVSIARARVADGVLNATLAVRNLTGHKLPTGYPSRRVWLHVIVRDRDGRLLFESGAVTGRGAIQGNDNDADAARVEPHYTEIRRGDEVQIYESVMAAPDGTVTTGLLRATQYVKDNRLLPRGFDKATAAADIAVHGAALTDPDFSAAGDDVHYAVPVGMAPGPLVIEAELRFQPIGFRWADNLRAYDAPEPRRFVSYYDAMAASSSTVLARAVTVAGD